MDKQITVKIDTDGKLEIETSGFTGDSCLKATEGLKRALGGTVVDEEAKPEFYQQEATQNVDLGR